MNMKSDKKGAEIQKAKETLNIKSDTDDVDQGVASIQNMKHRTGTGEFESEEVEGVVDMDAYKKWRRIRALPILDETKDRKIKCSDGSTVDLAWIQGYLERKIEHLPVQEKNLIQERKDIYLKMHLKAMQFKQKAYGSYNVKKATAARKNKVKVLGFLKAKSESILELFGRMFTLEEIHKIVVEEWNFPCSYNDLITFKQENLALITEKQERHKREHSDLRLTHKRSRIEEYTWLYNKLVDKIKVTTNREDIRVMKDLLEGVRKEVEGEKLSISGGLDLKIEASINIHLQQEVFKEFSLTQIIIGRVASRMGINSSRLVESLQSSYYARYNRFLGNESDDADFAEMEYPSTQGYDFERIKVAHKEHLIEDAKKKSELKTEEGKIGLRVAQMGLKESLLAKLSEKTGTVKAQKLQIETEELKKRKREGLDEKLNLQEKPAKKST